MPEFDRPAPPSDPAFAPRGCSVYGVLLNDPANLARLAPAFDAPPYKAPPVAPVLYLKPRNTWAADGAVVAVPGEVRIDATLGAVIGRAATRAGVAEARDHVAGYVVVADLTLPHESVYRPAIRERCRDGFCPMSAVVAGPEGFDPARAEIVVTVDGREVHRRRLDRLVRPLARLIADVTDFMTLAEGDVLLLGPPEGAPHARAGQRVAVEVPGLAVVSFTLTAEDAS